MATSYKVSLSKADETVEIYGKVYKHGDSFELPAELKPDPEYSKFAKRPAFTFETSRRTRNVQTGAWSVEKDTKRVLLPVVEA